jgi:amino acid permease
MYTYSETLEFDLVVVLFVVAVMPLSVFLMQSRSRVARTASFGLLFLAVFYVVGSFPSKAGKKVER